MRDDKSSFQERLQRNPHLAGHTGQFMGKDDGGDGGEGACAGFGFLRGTRDQSASIEFRFLSGNSTWFSYHSLGAWWYNPSEGLLLKFSSDLVYVVLVRGSNLATPLGEGSIDLLHGIQGHRVLWIREMSEEEIRKVGDTGPTIDSITIVEFESNTELKEWLGKTAAAFLH